MKQHRDYKTRHSSFKTTAPSAGPPPCPAGSARGKAETPRALLPSLLPCRTPARRAAPRRPVPGTRHRPGRAGTPPHCTAPRATCGRSRGAAPAITQSPPRGSGDHPASPSAALTRRCDRGSAGHPQPLHSNQSRRRSCRKLFSRK